MRLSSRRSIVLTAAAAALFAPLGTFSAQAQPAASPITLIATRTLGAEAVTITGNAPATQPLEAALYATFSENIPTVLLSRRAVTTDAQGRFNATLPIAPAFFRNAIVTVVLQSLPAGPSARASLTVAAPNLPAPPDAIPPSVR
jgi:hypothetical protein